MKNINDNIEKDILQYHRLMFKVINNLRYIPSYIERDELEQVARIALWEALKKYDSEKNDNIITFLYKYMEHEIIDWLRKMSATVGRELIPETYEEPKDEKSNDCTETIAIDNTLLNEIYNIIGNDKEFNMFIDRFMNDMTYGQLESKYKMSRPTLKKVLDRLCNKLQDELNWEET